ncbi:MAG TPA: helix-turn-helix domain-containing protein [Candidatus Nanoarchaeia archaeon]|nr:helix-turn-helix domain-containing protein [Candidatus Nanoarchaeia archaeon]
MNPQVLEELGVTKNEAKVYLALLDLGKTKAGLLTRKTGIHRRNVYDAIEMLIQKGLVSYIKENNVRIYSAVSPSRLMEILKEKEENVKSLLPELEAKFNITQQKTETTFFRGKQALKAIFDDQLKEGKEILVLGACPFAKDIVKYYFQKYDNERKQKKIKVKALFTGKTDYAIPLAEIKYLPSAFNSPTATNVYGNKVAIILWTEEPFAILINQKEIADSYRNYFELLWKTAKNQ